MATNLKKCESCGSKETVLFKPFEDDGMPSVCSACQLDYEEDARVQEELDYLSAEYD